MAMDEHFKSREKLEDSKYRYEDVPQYDETLCPFCHIGWPQGSAWKPDPARPGSETRRCIRGHAVKRTAKK